MKTLLALALVTFCFALPAAEVFWVKLNLDYRYDDPGVKCTNGLASNLLYLGVEVEGTKVLRASLREYPFATLRPSGPDFLPWEVANLEVFYDDKYGYWLTHWRLSPRLAAWLLTGPNMNLCRPKFPIASIEPSILPFRFELGGVLEGVGASHTPRVKFSGLRQDGVPFRAEIKLQQRRYVAH